MNRPQIVNLVIDDLDDQSLVVKHYINQLEQENEQLMANNNRLRLAALDAIHFMPGGDAKAELCDAYDETPEQSLNEHYAEVIDQFIKEIEDLGFAVDTGGLDSAWVIDIDRIKDRAQLRQKVQD